MSKIPDKVFMIGGGGLGDIIRCYLMGIDHWKRLAALKQRYPTITVKAILCSHNPAAKEFLELNPFLSSVEYYPWQLNGWPVFNAHRDGHVFIGEIPRIFSYQERENVIYISPQEQERLNEIKNKGKYVVFHPFAGLGDRIAFKPNDYEEITKQLAQEGIYSVFVGNTYNRTNHDKEEPQSEKIEFSHSHVINMVGCSTTRLNVRLIQEAFGFAGTHSCYILPAWYWGKTSVLLAPTKLKDHLMSSDSNSWVTKQNLVFNKTIYLDSSYNVSTITDEVVKKLLGE